MLADSAQADNPACLHEARRQPQDFLARKHNHPAIAPGGKQIGLMTANASGTPGNRATSLADKPPSARWLARIA